jgi:hypothetical protein
MMHTLALLLAICGLAWFAFAMERHWRQVRDGLPLPPATSRRLRVAGGVALLASLGACLAVDHASMASLVFVMFLAVAALIVALLLAWRPHWLAPLLRFAR